MTAAPAPPIASSPTRDVILDAAERIFGQSGFSGSSMREISAAADVAQALLHYHFKNKEALYREVFGRRAAVITNYRRARLASLFDALDTPTLEAVLAIIATPLSVIFADTGQDSRFYLQMVAEVTVATDERSVAIVDTFYDPIGREMIAALVRVLPELSPERAKWSYLFAIGARLQAHAHNHRAVRLGPQATNRSPHELLVPFLAAGIRAMAALTDAPGPRRTAGRKAVKA